MGFGTNDVWDLVRVNLRFPAVGLRNVWLCVKASKQDSQARAQSQECLAVCWQVSRRAAAADGLPVQAARRGLGAVARDASVRSQQPLMF